MTPGARVPAPAALAHTLSATARTAASLCEANDALIFQVEGDSLVTVAKHGPLPTTRSLGSARVVGRDTPEGRATIERRAIHVRDMAVAVRTTYPARRDVQRALGVRTLLAVPLLHEDRAIGVIMIRRTRVQPFTPRQISLLKTFASQAALAIENTRLSAELGDRNRELEVRNRELSEALDQQTATADILRVISHSPTNLQPVLDAIATSAARVCGAYDATVVLREGDFVRRVAHHGPIGSHFREVRPISRGFATGRAILDRHTVHVHDILDAEAADLSEARESAKRSGFRTLLAVPMIREGDAIGSLAIRRQEIQPFADTEITLLQTFADQAVIAIENVRLFTELQARNRDLTEALDRQTATAEILRVISQAQTDVQPVFDVIADSAMRLLGAWSAVVFRYDGEFMRLAAARGGLPGSSERVMERLQAPRRPSVDFPPDRAVMTRALQHVVDVDLDTSFGPGLREDARVRGFRSVVMVPMLRGGDAVGVIAVTRAQVGGFTPAEIALLETFADQAVIAVENARLLTELQAKNADLTEALDRQTATAEILRVISSSPTDLQPVLDAVAESSARLCESHDAQIMLLDGDELKRAASYGTMVAPATGYRPTRGSVGGRAVIDRAVVHVRDLAAEIDTEYPDARAAQGTRTGLAAPLMRESAPIGVILIRRLEVRPFSDRQIELLQTFADQAVIAIENVRLFKELEARNRELTAALEQQTATAEILRVISSSPTDLQPVMDAVAQNAARVCGAADAVIWRIDGSQLRRAAHFGSVPIKMPDLVAIGRDTPFGRAILERRTIHVEDVVPLLETEYSAIKSAAIAAGAGTRLVAPLMREGVPIGAILIRRTAVQPFTDKQIALLETFADQAVIAIENVRLFKELQMRTEELSRSVRELRALGEVGQAVSSTLDLETVLTTIASRANQLAGTDACTVQEYDEATETFHQRATYNMPEEIAAIARSRPVRKGEGAVGRLPVTREPVQIVDIAEPGAYFGPLREPLLRAGVRALLAIPLLREEHLTGALIVFRNTPGAFSGEVIELLKTFATQSAIAIQNARLFREIEAKGRQLEIASRHKSQFLANMSHELRTPLNAILGYTELIADKIYGEVPERMGEVLERVDKSGRHLLSLINDILDLSKIEAGQLKLAPVDYSMEDIVRSVAATTEPLAAAKQLTLVMTVGPDLPLGWGDARRLNQVLLNLVGNAIKFTDAGQVTVDARSADDRFVVAVSDTGPGIADGDRERIFEEFQQAETTTKGAKGGTGLGLAIARRIIEMHGGRLWLESTLGNGSTFTFSVPIRAADPRVTARGEA
jgi:GAF domain-containing protein